MAFFWVFLIVLIAAPLLAFGFHDAWKSGSGPGFGMAYVLLVLVVLTSFAIVKGSMS